jgi:hypothetical protein
LKILDPAEAYFRAASPATRSPVYHGAAFLSPAGPGEARQATEAELETRREDFRRARRAEVDEDAVRREYGGELRSMAVELAAGAQVTFTCPNGRLECGIIRFWRGDSLLEIAEYGPTGQGRGQSLTRLCGPRTTTVDTVTHYLVLQVSLLLER